MGKIMFDQGDKKVIVDDGDIKNLLTNYRPSDVRYGAAGFHVGEHFFECENPRLEYCRVLAMFSFKDQMREHHGSWVHSSAKFQGTVKVGIGCTIGGPGFGYEYDEFGKLIPMPHLGGVVIGDGVTIHNQVNIDRGVTEDTVIGEGTKIDSLVHVAHGVRIGKHCLIVSGTVFGGSCEIGDYCFIGMNACIKQKVKIGRTSVVGAGAVVTKDIPDNQIWIGSPARYMKDTEPRPFEKP
jgi:UDP-3-O-[3-hydroxymyristoyl] glucosamine N-acyltransferase LpxD